MSQASKTIHDFQALNLGQSNFNVTDVSSALTLTAQHSGDIISLNATGGCAVTLPFPTAGLLYQFVVNNTGAHALTAPSACINGGVCNAVSNTGGSSLATITAKTVVSTTSGSAVGDSFTLTANGSKYFLKGNVAQYNAIKFT